MRKLLCLAFAVLAAAAHAQTPPRQEVSFINGHAAADRAMVAWKQNLATLSGNATVVVQEVGSPRKLQLSAATITVIYEPQAAETELIRKVFAAGNVVMTADGSDPRLGKTQTVKATGDRLEYLGATGAVALLGEPGRLAQVNLATATAPTAANQQLARGSTTAELTAAKLTARIDLTATGGELLRSAEATGGVHVVADARSEDLAQVETQHHDLRGERATLDGVQQWIRIVGGATPVTGSSKLVRTPKAATPAAGQPAPAPAKPLEMVMDYNVREHVDVYLAELPAGVAPPESLFEPQQPAAGAAR